MPCTLCWDGNKFKLTSIRFPRHTSQPACLIGSCLWNEDFCARHKDHYIRANSYKLQKVELSLNFSLETAEIELLFPWCVFVHVCIGTEKGRIQKLCKLANTKCANHWTRLQCLLDGIGKKPELKVMVWTASPHYFQGNWFCCNRYITLDLKRKKWRWFIISPF